MVTKGADGPIHDLYVRLLLTRDMAELKRLSFRLSDSDLTMEGTVRNWATKPVMTAKLESNQMDIDLLIPKGQRAPIRDLLEWLAATSKVSATASIARGRYKHLKFGAMSARMTIQDGVLDLDRMSGQSTNGILPVASWCNSRAGSRRRPIALRATGLLVEDMYRLAGSKGGGITGEARITGTVRGHGRNPHGIYPTLNGRADLCSRTAASLNQRNVRFGRLLAF